MSRTYVHRNRMSSLDPASKQCGLRARCRNYKVMGRSTHTRMMLSGFIGSSETFGELSIMSRISTLVNFSVINGSLDVTITKLAMGFKIDQRSRKIK